MASVKVLLSGDPQGKLGALFKRVAAVNKSNGPFDYLFCVGSFFPPADPSDMAEADQELLAYIKGDKEVPIPTFFIGGFGQGSQQALATLSDASNSRLQYFGAAGVAKLKGLNVAYLDGTQGSASGNAADEQHGLRHHSQAHVDRVISAVEATEGDIDLLLTCEWPADVATGVPAASLPAGLQPGGSDAAAKLAVAVRPRYHIAGAKGVFWARPPYMNKDLGAGGHATRFLGLGAVGNTAKQKSLHALGLVPAASMSRSELTAKPEGATPSPYEAAAAKRKRSQAEAADDSLGAQDWRWQDKKKARPPQAPPSLGRPGVVKDDKLSVYVRNLPFIATEGDVEEFFAKAGAIIDIRRGTNAEGKLQGFGFVQFGSEGAVQRALEMHGAVFMGRELFIDAASRPAQSALPSGQPVPGCWFCLSNPNADVELVASVGEECYLAVDKGAINEGHVLVLPIEHFPNSLGLSAGCHAELERYMSALRSCFASQGRELMAFERFMSFRKSGGNHCHINVVSCPAAAASSARQTLDRAAAAIGAEFTELAASGGEAGRAALREAAGEGEFLRVLLPGGVQLVHPIARGERFPLNFGREVAAAIAGVPERADWKQCQLDLEAEKQRTARFKAAFKSFDIMQ